MKNLPVEILNRIFLQLHQHDKFECMKVCSHWKFIIKKYSLFHTVRIGQPAQIRKLIRKVQQEPNLGQKVERLIFDMATELLLETNELFRYFPNVRSFTKLNGVNPEYLASAEKDPPSFNKNQMAWNNIEHIQENAGCIVTSRLLTLGSCINLTRISVTGMGYEPGKRIIDVLLNAPALKLLRMSNFSFSLIDLETLHQNVPHLRSLRLSDGQIECNTPPVEIRPATLVTTVEMKTMCLRFTKDELKLLEYLYSKYPNTVDLAYEVLKIERIEPDLLNMFKNHLMSFFMKIQSKLKKLSLRMNNNGLKPFDILDSAGCRVKNLTLTGSIEQSMIQELVESNQSKYIQSLTLDKLDERLPLEYMNKFEVLKDLTIAYSINSQNPGKGLNKLNIGELVKILPAFLHSLTISGADLTLNHVSIYHYPLKKLSLIKSKIPCGFDHFISESFYKLENLVLISCKFKDKTLLMPKSRLRYFKFVCSLPKSKNNILVITLSNNDRRFYTAKASCFSSQLYDINDPFFYPAIISVHHDITFTPPFMSFVFDSLRSCFLVNSIY